MDAIDTNSGNPMTADENGQPTEPVEEQPTDEVVEEKPVETPTPPVIPPAPSQLDPLAELDKLTALDPKVKESLKAGFMRQSDYTRKTQDIARFRKEYEEYLNTKIEANKSKVTPEEPSEDEIPDDPREFAKYTIKKAKQEALDEMREEIRKERETQAANVRLNTDVQEASKLDTRLATDEAFAKQIAGLVQVNSLEDIRTGKISVTEATKAALDEYKKNEESFRQKVLSEVNDKAKNKTMVMPKGNGSPMGTAPKGGARTMREAAAQAEEELGR